MSEDPKDIATDFYSPRDSRLLSFSSFFCKGIKVETNSTATGATIALVNSTPTLANKNSFRISVRRTLRSEQFHVWQYYLYPNSNISVTACNLRSAPVDVYLVKGNSNANNWGRSPSSDHAELYRSVFFECPQQQTITYKVNEEDNYYVFVNSYLRIKTSYSASLQFERFQYSIPPGNASESSHSCFAPSGGKCRVDIPYGTGSQQALVVTTVPENVNWDEKVDMNINCDRRIWAYAIIITLPTLATIFIIVSIATTFSYYGYRVESKHGWFWC